MHATDVIAWTADADYWCTTCAERAYGPDSDTRADREGNPVHPVFGSDDCLSRGIRCGSCEDVIVEPSCDCDTTEYLPCEQHAETLAQWNGSSSRSADQLNCIAVRELVRVSCEHRNPGHDHDHDTSLSGVHGCESLVLSDDDLAALLTVERETSSDPFTSWADDRDAADAVREMCDELERDLPAGVVAHWDDGFALWRITGGPLLACDCPCHDPEPRDSSHEPAQCVCATRT
jgi:hypothetical protein